MDVVKIGSNGQENENKRENHSTHNIEYYRGRGSVR